jgi:hypothetical protein
MQYLFKATKAMTRAFMSIIALRIAIVALCTRPWKRRSAA